METDASPLRRYRGDRTLESLSADFGVDKSTLLRWEEGKVPPARVLDVERITGISRHVLRPDIFGDAPPIPSQGKAA